MATAVVSGRVDGRIKMQADRYIHAAGLSTGDVIRTVWEHIARTGEVPREERRKAPDEISEAMRELKELRTVFGSSDWLVNLTDDQMKDMLGGRDA